MSKNRTDRAVNWTFSLIIGVPIVLLALWLIIGLLVIVFEDKAYARELDNPYVNSEFEDWHTVTIEQTKMAIPDNWEVIYENKELLIMQDGKCIGQGVLLNGRDAPYETEEAFLAQALETTVEKANCVITHSLLKSNFGKVYVNDSEQLQGYYLMLGNDESNLFIYFSSSNHTGTELQSIAEAIIFYHQYRQ